MTMATLKGSKRTRVPGLPVPASEEFGSRPTMMQPTSTQYFVSPPSLHTDPSPSPTRFPPQRYFHQAYPQIPPAEGVWGLVDEDEKEAHQ